MSKGPEREMVTQQQKPRRLPDDVMPTTGDTNTELFHRENETVACKGNVRRDRINVLGYAENAIG